MFPCNNIFLVLITLMVTRNIGVGVMRKYVRTYWCKYEYHTRIARRGPRATRAEKTATFSKG